MTTKSIIGRDYIPRDVLAVCIETDTDARLGETKYRIIKNPYERIFKFRGLWGDLLPHRYMRIAVNVLDENTGLTYAVQYEPANLVCDDRTTNQPDTPVDFATHAQQIADELKVMFDSAGEGISDKCGVAFFAVSDDGNDKTSTCTGFLGGRGNRVAAAIASACFKNPKVFDIVRRASIEATFHQIFDGGDKKK